MLKELIQEGILLEKQRIENIENIDETSFMSSYKKRLLSQSIDGKEFNVWLNKVINYLQKNHSELITVQNIFEEYPNVTASSSLEFYKKVMNILNTLDTE